MMSDTNNAGTAGVASSSMWGILILIFLFFIVFNRDGYGGFGGAGFGGGCGPFGGVMPTMPVAPIGFGGGYHDIAGGNHKTLCDVEKQEIIDSARNLYAIETSTNRTIEAGNLNTQRLYDQSSRQYEAGLQEKLFDLKLNAQTDLILKGQELSQKDAKITALENVIYNDRKFDAVTQQINAVSGAVSSLACQTPKRPEYYAQGYVCSGTPIPQPVCGLA